MQYTQIGWTTLDILVLMGECSPFLVNLCHPKSLDMLRFDLIFVLEIEKKFELPLIRVGPRSITATL